MPAGAHGEETAFFVRAAQLFRGRRRLEAGFHTPLVRAILQRFDRFQPLSEVTSGVWWGKRFKRIPSPGGQPYLSADDLFTTNPYAIEKIIAADDVGTDQLRVQPGWIVMACSGQTYGLNGSAMIMTEYHKGFLLSHDLIRIAPNSKIRSGFLLTALTHPELGRPLVLREAYGSSIPHLEPQDIATVPIARLDQNVEDAPLRLPSRCPRLAGALRKGGFFPPMGS